MKRIIALVVCWTIVSVWGETTVDHAATSTTHKSITIEPTVKPPVIPNTVKPSTSNKPSTTVTTTNNTKISTTEVPKLTTTPAPVFDPKPYKWFLNGTNSSIIIQMATEIIILYQNSSSKQNLSIKIDIPANNKTLVNGSFSQYDETFILSWNSSGLENNSVLFHFKRFMNSYVLHNIEVSIDSKSIPNNSNSTLKLINKHEHFNISMGNSYRCVRLQTFNLTRENDTAVAGYMKVTDLQFQAFKSDRKAVFGYAEDCAFDTPDVVPIVVGIILSGLVICVLTAYLVSRRRSEARGYLSLP